MYHIYYAQQDEQQPSALKRWGHRAVVGAAVLGGPYFGARALYPLLVRGRPLRAGESIAGKLLSRPTEHYTPLQLLSTALGKDPYKLQKKVQKVLGAHPVLRRGVEAVEKIKIRPGRHFSVGLPEGKEIWEKGDFVQGFAPKSDLWRTAGRAAIRVHGEFPLTTEAARAAFLGRMIAMGSRPSKFHFVCNNCEHAARALAGLPRKSLQIRSVIAGGLSGPVVFGGGAEVLTHPRRKRENA